MDKDRRILLVVAAVLGWLWYRGRTPPAGNGGSGPVAPWFWLDYGNFVLQDSQGRVFMLVGSQEGTYQWRDAMGRFWPAPVIPPAPNPEA